MDQFSPLTGVIRADAAVIGGGWTGLTAAAALAAKGLRVVLAESGLLPDEPVLPALPGTVESLRRVRQWHGFEAVRTYTAMQMRVMTSLPGWLSGRAPFYEADFHTYARTARMLPALEDERQLLHCAGLHTEYALDAGGCPFPVERSLRRPGLLIDAQALKTVLIHRILGAGGRVFCHSGVLNVSVGQVFTAEGRIDAPRVLLCTGKPLGLASTRLLALLETRTILQCRLIPDVPLLSPQRSAMVGGLRLIPGPGSVSLRWTAGRTGTRPEQQRSAHIRNALPRLFPDWAAEEPQFRLEVHPLDGLPVIGRWRTSKGELLLAAGLGEPELTSRVLAAQVLCRLALSLPRPADRLFSPSRCLPYRLRSHTLMQLRKHRTLMALHRKAPPCSHCGCHLRWFPAADWWSCPACGSAFGMLGRRLSGPALQDATIAARQRPGWY